MPSASLTRWQGDRMPRLAEVDSQVQASQAASPANPRLADENLRGFVLLLSAHFQGFCRDLHTECAQVVASKVRPTLEVLVQQQFMIHRKLDHGNPTLDNIKADFNRFGFSPTLAAGPANLIRSGHLGELNRWRNIIAHHGTVPPGGLPALTVVRSWRDSCTGLATSLDATMYDRLRVILRRRPWTP